MFDWFSHPFILTPYPFNVLRKVFKRFVVRLRESSIRLSGISGKTLKPVSFHTGSRGVLFDGIRFQQAHNTIACLQFNHVQLFESTTDCFTLQFYGELEIQSNRTPLLPVVSELHTIKVLIKHLH